MKHIDLSNREHHFQNTTDAFHLLQVHVGADIDSVDLSANCIGVRRGLDFAALFSTLQSVRKLSLRDNFLGCCPGSNLSEMTGPLVQLELLDLSNNFFAYKKGLDAADFERIFQACQAPLKSLNLSNNGLGLIRPNVLSKVFQKLRDPLQSVDLSGNDFVRYSVAEMGDVLRALPSSVEYIDLCRNDLEDWPLSSREPLTDLLLDMGKSVRLTDDDSDPLLKTSVLEIVDKKFSGYCGLFKPCGPKIPKEIVLEIFEYDHGVVKWI